MRGVLAVSCLVSIAWATFATGCADDSPTNGPAGGGRAAIGGKSAKAGAGPVMCPSALPNEGDSCPPGAGGCTYGGHQCVCTAASIWLCQHRATGGSAGVSATDCVVGSECTTLGSTCTGENGTCSCVQGSWGLCVTPSTGGTGAGGTSAAVCAPSAPCAVNFSTCVDGDGITWCCWYGAYVSCLPAGAGGTAASGGRAAMGGRRATGGRSTGGRAATSGGEPGETGGEPGETGGEPGETGGEPGETGGEPAATGGEPAATGGEPAAIGGNGPGGGPAICEPKAACFELEFCAPAGGGVCYCEDGSLTCIGGPSGAGGAGGTAETAGAGGLSAADCAFGAPCTGTFSTCSVEGITCLCLGDVYVLCA